MNDKAVIITQYVDVVFERVEWDQCQVLNKTGAPSSAFKIIYNLEHNNNLTASIQQIKVKLNV